MNTLSAKNEARIKCPTLGVVVKVADCSSFRDRVWRGERPEERRGCQACMASSKCAIAQVIHDMRLGTNDPGLYSPTEKIMALDAKLLERLGRISVMDRTLDKFMVPDDERLAIASAKTAAPIDTSDWSSPAQPTRKRRVKSGETPEKPAATEDAVVSAAVSGDMSAAISRAAEKSKTAPAPKPVEVAPKPKPQSKPAEPASTAGLSLLERARLNRQGKAA